MIYAVDNADFKARRLRAVKEDLNTGAATLARKTLEDIIDFSDCCDAADTQELVTELTDLVTQLSAARPSMVSIQNALRRWSDCLENLPADDLKEARRLAQMAAEEVIEELQNAQVDAVAACVKELKDGMTIMTHSTSSSVMSLFNACYQAGIKLQAIVTESRPGMEGRKLARFLNKLAIPTQFISEAQMAYFVPQADKVIVGADSLLRDGTLVNKVGSRLLALAARDSGIPFWVLAESFKHSLTLPEDVVLEEMPEDEMQLEELEKVQVRNIYFDLIPARFITAWVDEQGVRVEFRSLAEASRVPLLAAP
ncbi:translation initiation factor eIF-2B [Marinospirillum perlucidum]|uniref:translation initiation factor eIF-2B n=1 Tax=Marinospirillum perlucidum TaxID=1982602 RepID=UPI000DF1EDB0|nr:translation initiation factor eIF-2B [Marinospirillum perlucidum]